MQRAFEFARAGGYRRTVLVGSDIADVQPSDLHLAFEELRNRDSVLGPARDGGFYLIGLRRRCPAVFEPEGWGGGGVFERAFQALKDAGLSVSFTPERSDVDHPEDLDRLRADPCFTDRVSVVVPTLNPEGRVRTLIERLRAELWPGDEVVAVAGTDDAFPQAGGPPGCAPRQIPAASPVPAMGDPLSSAGTGDAVPVRLLHCPKGRGRQLHRGARAANGDILWFLHDDCDPPANFGYLLRKLQPGSPFSFGCFRLDYFPATPALQLLADWANLRTRLLRLPYGDQGIFCRRAVYEKTGGFRRPYLMEDVDFVRRARRLGPMLVLSERLRTSAERYLKGGVLATGVRSHLTMLMYLLGMEENILYQWYYDNITLSKLLRLCTRSIRSR
jgi:hypothetical protein